MQTVLWHALADRSGCDDADRSAGSDPWTKGVRQGSVRTCDVIRVARSASEGIQVKAPSSVVDCSVLNWVEQKELRGLASDDRLFGRVAELGWMLMDFNNNSKCRMGGEDLSHIQFNPKLWNLRPVVKDSGDAMRVPVWPEAYAHVKENQQVWLSGSRPLPDQCPRYPPIRRMLLGVTSPAIAPRMGVARDAEEKMRKWIEGMEPRFIGWNVAVMHTFDFTFPDAWSRKKIKEPSSRRPVVSADVWNDVHTPADDWSRLK